MLHDASPGRRAGDVAQLEGLLRILFGVSTDQRQLEEWDERALIRHQNRPEHECNPAIC